MIRSFWKDHYKRWFDEPIPALEGLTPRQAAKDPKKRPLLVELLKDYENHEEADRRAGRPVYGVDKLRRKLGLDKGKG